jgi:hypothetical protein
MFRFPESKLGILHPKTLDPDITRYRQTGIRIRNTGKKP